MAKKENKATKKVDPEKDAKRKARMEALKNRPAEQRPNSKQIDIIDLGDGNVVKNFAYAVKEKATHVGVLVTSVALKDGNVTGTSVTWVPGNLSVKAKKGHGTICAPKSKKESDSQEEETEAED
jgi:hypothetical protein